MSPTQQEYWDPLTKKQLAHLRAMADHALGVSSDIGEKDARVLVKHLLITRIGSIPGARPGSPRRPLFQLTDAGEREAAKADP